MGNPGDFVAEVRLGRQTEQPFQSFDLAPQGLVLLDLQFVGGVQAGQIAPGFEEGALGMQATAPESLEVADEGRCEQDRRLKFIKTHPQERPAEHGQQNPGGDDHAESEEGAGLDESIAEQGP